MKRITGLIMGMIILLMQQGMGLAATHIRQMTTNLPMAASAAVTFYKVTPTADPDHPNFSLWTQSTLDFGIASYNSGAGYSYWAPGYAFAVEVTPVGGVGLPVVTVNCSNFVKPAGAVYGLERKAVMAFMKAVPDSDDVFLSPGRKIFANVNNIAVPPAELIGGTLRIYIGIFTGAPALTDALVFSNADIPGNYQATVTITTSVQ